MTAKCIIIFLPLWYVHGDFVGNALPVTEKKPIILVVLYSYQQQKQSNK